MSSMNFSKRLPLFLSFFFLLSSSSSSALNITNLLSEYDEFSTFTNLLGQTNLADDINSRQTITLLVVENSAFSSLTGQPDNVVKKILSLHVILDYFDKQKLQKLEKKTALLTTLFQSSGQAKDQQGFLNVTLLSDGTIAFGSAVPGAAHNSNLVKSVTSQPYNISILQVSSVIAPPGMVGGGGGGGSNSSTTGTSPSSSSSQSPGASPANPPDKSATPPNKETPDQVPTPSAAGKSPKPSPSKAPTPSTAGFPDASSPTDAEEPSAAESPTDNIAPSDSNSPIGSPPEPTAGGASGPVADGPAAGGSSSAAPIDGLKMGALAVIFASTWYLF